MEWLGDVVYRNGNEMPGSVARCAERQRKSSAVRRNAKDLHCLGANGNGVAWWWFAMMDKQRYKE